MLTAWFTFISVLILIVALISKVLFLSKHFWKSKTFLHASIEMFLSVIALVFLITITVTTAYHSTIDSLMLANAFESTIYLQFGSVIFILVGFFYTLESIVILFNNIFNSRRGYMSSKKNNSKQSRLEN